MATKEKTPTVEEQIEALKTELETFKTNHEALKKEHQETLDGMSWFLTTPDGLSKLDELASQSKEKLGIAPKKEEKPLQNFMEGFDASNAGENEKILMGALGKLAGLIEEKDKGWKELSNKIESTWGESKKSIETNRLALKSVEAVKAKYGIDVTPDQLSSAMLKYGDDPIKAAWSAFPEEIQAAMVNRTETQTKPNHLKTQQSGPVDFFKLNHQEKIQYLKDNPEAVDEWESSRGTPEHQNKILEELGVLKSSA